MKMFLRRLGLAILAISAVQAQVRSGQPRFEVASIDHVEKVPTKN